MIQISKTSYELESLAIQHFTTLIDIFSIDKKLDEIISDKKNKAYEKVLFSKFKFNLKKIITGVPDELVAVNSDLLPYYNAYISKKSYGLKGKHKKSAIQKANNKIFHVFDYSMFVRKNSGKYAYQFTEDLQVSVCVYCNRQYTTTIWGDDGKCRPTLDHFFDKATYPYFALSFYNLVPSCYTCNSSLKNQRKFSLEHNLHPFIESMYDVLDFSVKISSIDFVEGKNKDFEITMKPNRLCVNAKLIEKAQANSEIFKLVELYNSHKDQAADIIKKMYYYDRSKIDELYNYETSNGNKLFDSRTEVLEFTLGNFLNKEKLGSKALSKFTRDIAVELGMDKLL
ncbi:hypothetical protein V1389_10090 [Flavobacterium rakeshii]|uniref:hypothetical protein n=1 Tax=Flavobacterium rakeshii TaxID=1038845 RepID=UPI002E7BB4DE|nr:hypothetical protein [Flavobacterium rakeshii]MEE1898687.1 hypothetical protein [Flavobacterium rakeshii]